MRSPVWVALMWLSSCFATVQAAGMAFEYPSAMLDIQDAGQTCWFGMGSTGDYVVRVVPEKWLVGPPPFEFSAVTFPSDEWIDLAFSGPIVHRDGNDIELVEWGRAGEQALVFLTDGDAQEYLLGLAKASAEGGQLASYIDLRVPTIALPFVPRALRIVAIDDKGSSPGFDLASVRAWVSHDCGAEAGNPNPVSGALRVPPDVKLAWTPACLAAGQVIYLGSSESGVLAAAPDAQRATLSGDANVFDPCGLTLGRTYYWRVDKVMPDSSVVAGPVWHFTVADHVLVDDFEAYGTGGMGQALDDFWFIPDAFADDGANRAWRYVPDGDPIWHSCQQSLVFMYYYDSQYYSEVYRPFAVPQDWLRTGVRAIQLWLYGTALNATAGQMYVSVNDSHGHRETVPFVIPDISSLTRPEWTVCRAGLAGLSQVDLNDVQGIGIGFRLPEDAPDQDYRGTIHIDDITLHPTLCLDSERPLADTNGDCVIDYRDIRRMASEWLVSRTNKYPVAEPNLPVLWYEFNGNTFDSAGVAPGQIEGRPSYVTGKHGKAIAFGNAGDAIEIPPSQAASLFAGTREALTIAFWQIGDDSTHLNDTICCSNYVYGQSDPSISINLGCWKDPGQYRWDCGTPWSFANRVAGRHHSKLEWTGRWNHWAFTKDIRVGPAGAKGRMEIYLNGVLYDSRTGTDSPIEGITSFEIGQGWYGRYDGLLDDFQIYDYALSAPEVAYLASDGTGVLEAAVPLAADLDYNDFVDFSDYARLASEWLAEGLWP
jgi:hypothetical protein